MLKKQREQVQQYVIQLEKQLPSKAEMSALLSDINQAGLGRNLQFELFRPDQIVVKDYYAELPISIRIIGRYHDIGAFAADVANLSRIVTLNNISLVPVAKEGGGNLTLEATARTFRYLDPEEIQAQKDATKKKKAGANDGPRTGCCRWQPCRWRCCWRVAAVTARTTCAAGCAVAQHHQATHPGAHEPKQFVPSDYGAEGSSDPSTRRS